MRRFPIAALSLVFLAGFSGLNYAAERTKGRAAKSASPAETQASADSTPLLPPLPKHSPSEADKKSEKPGSPPPSPSGGSSEEAMGKGLPDAPDALHTPLEQCDLDYSRDSKEGLADVHKERMKAVTFAVKFGDDVSPYPLITTSVMPGETLDFEAVLTGREGRFHAATATGKLETTGSKSWRWHAPKAPGNYCIRIEDQAANESMCLNTFVLTPYDGSPSLNGFQIGQYAQLPEKEKSRNAPPRGFIEVTEKNKDTWLSPHFQLHQFLSRQEGGFPKYTLVQTRLLLKLEMLLEQLNERGIKADSFYVMSSYRTPYYNAKIGNKTSQSRHSYGDAADIFVDQDRDGMIDDLNHDGVIDDQDARVLQWIVEELQNQTFYRPFVGGLGFYSAAGNHGPFIHVDTRGQFVEW